MKIRYTIEGPALGIHPVHGEIEVPDEELAGLSDEARDTCIHEWVEAEVNNQVQWGWEPAEDDR